MKDFDAVVFDMDGLIFDSERAGFVCWSEVLRAYGYEDITALYRECIGCSRVRVERVVRGACGEGFPFERFESEVQVLYTARYGGGKMPLKPGAREILRYLKAQGIRTALASSSKKDVVLELLGSAGLLEYFDEIVTGDMAARSKPEPDIFLKACEMLGARPERCIAVEDSFNGIRAAHRGGLRPIMVPDMLPADAEMRELAEAVKDDLFAVMEYLAGKSES